MTGPKRVVLEYEDLTRREIDFDKLGRQAQMELAALGHFEIPSPERPKSYLLLQWKDGWKEVVATDERATELLRYYTVERVEQIGRLSLDVAGGNPELLFVKRLPDRLESILLVGSEEPQAYALEEKVTVKEGGKVEHVFYDKKRPNFSKQDAAAASVHYAEFLDVLEKELQQKGVTATSVLAKDEDERLALYKELTIVLGLRGTERQQDAYGFLQAALEKLVQPERKTRAATNN